MLRALASHGSTVTAVLFAAPCARLISLLRWVRVRDAALSALAQISEHPEGVAAIAATDILSLELSGNFSTEIQFSRPPHPTELPYLQEQIGGSPSFPILPGEV
ncbi:hypothetical protein DFH09DRAFT_1097045 [Mycena vulgaris]|nr:hypothetical protein DFH09DRAFT_1097045 [Mycena vulgaris]